MTGLDTSKQWIPQKLHQLLSYRDQLKEHHGSALLGLLDLGLYKLKHLDIDPSCG